MCSATNSADRGGRFPPAVFLHISEAELAKVLARTATAAWPGGLLAFTLKEGDGSHWTTAKLDRPRHFTDWREPELRLMIEASPWEVVAVEHATGPAETWLHCLCVLPGGTGRPPAAA